MVKHATVLVEDNTQLSKSIIWDLQREFFEKEGVNAWEGQVPYYITSNPYIAECYAEVAIRFIQDHVRQPSYDPKTPFYILELGTGPGRFSFYCMRRLFQMQESLNMQNINICYVMTDFTESNLSFWKSHPIFQDYFERGKLDFAIFDMESDADIQLKRSGVILTQKTVKNPLIVFGNYIFDTVTNDAFRIENKKIQEAAVRVKTTEANLHKGRPVKLDYLETAFDYRDIDVKNYYKDPYLNKVLMDYEKSLEKSSILFPLGGFRALNKLITLSSNRLMLISSDKANSTLMELDGRSDPDLVFHGSFSITVNFHAIGEYFKHRGGHAFHQTLRNTLKTSVFILGDELKNLPETVTAIDFFVEGNSPGDIYNIYKQFSISREECTPKSLQTLMAATHWDPHIFNVLIETMVEKIPTGDAVEVAGFHAGIKHIVDNIYLLPGGHDTFFDVAIVCHAINKHADAIQYYKESLAHFKKNFITYYNIGLCYYALHESKEALSFFKKALEVDSKNEDARDWVKRIEKQLL